MRKPLLVLLTILMFGAFAAFAQNSTSSPPSSAPPSAQTSSQSSTGASAGEQTIDGCIVRIASTYYIQPANGSPTKLSGSSDVASHTGEHVVVHGSQQSSGAANTGANPGSSSAAGGQPSGSSGEQTFNVTRLDTVSTNCPAGMQPKDTSNPK
jgi:hypothetical protein